MVSRGISSLRSVECGGTWPRRVVRSPLAEADAGRLIKEGFRRLALLFVDPDDPMGTAFVVRLGVPDTHFEDKVAPLVGIPQTQTCNDGSEETFVAGCTPFLANPCEMKEDADAISQYASFCASAPALSGIGLRYPRVLEIPFERGDQGKSHLRLDL